jgi:Family of unknown function (DUF6364)
MFALLRRRSPQEATMSKETLSVELDSGLVDRVRRYSEEHGTDVAETISDLISSLPHSGRVLNGDGPAAPATHVTQGEDAGDWEAQLTPGVRRLLGAGAGQADEEDYHRYIEEKYGR